MYKRLGAYLFHNSARVVCCSRYERDLVITHFGDSFPTQVVAPGSDLPFLQPR